MGRFTNPRDLYFGEGARHEVKNLHGEALKAIACRFMQALQRTLQRIRHYFDDEHLTYACV